MAHHGHPTAASSGIRKYSSSGQSRRTVAALLLGCLALGLQAPACDAHGFLSNPRSRVLALGYDEYTASSGNGLRNNNSPDVCGDPHQDAGALNIANRPTAIQGESWAGATGSKHP